MNFENIKRVACVLTMATLLSNNVSVTSIENYEECKECGDCTKIKIWKFEYCYCPDKQ